MKDVKRERDLLRDELVSAKRQKTNIKSNNSLCTTNVTRREPLASKDTSSQVLTPPQFNFDFNINDSRIKYDIVRTPASNRTPTSSMSFNTPHSSRKLEIRANAMDLVKEASFALRSTKKEEF